MIALLAALAVPGPPQQLILGHLSLQDRLHLSATCTALQTSAQQWRWEVPVVINSFGRDTDLAALRNWLRRHPGCDLQVVLQRCYRVQPLLPALGPLPAGAIVQLQAAASFTWHGISALTRLRQLGLALRRGGAQGLEELERLPNLTHLWAWSVPEHEATAADLAPLWRLTQLQHLSVSRSEQSVLLETLPALSAMPLRYLSMRRCTEAGLVALLPAVRAVTSLYCHFDWPPSPEADWPQQLQLLTQLQELQLSCSRLTAVPASLPLTLTKLELRLQRVPLMELHRLTRLHQLRSLSLACGMYLHGGIQAVLEGLPPLPQLLKLDLSYCKLQAVPATLAAQTALTMLQLNTNRIQSGWEHLAPLTCLRELELQMDPKCTSEELGDDECLHAIPPAFSCLTSLTRLSLAGQGRIRRGWHHLQPLSQLQRLDLQRMRLARMPHGLTAALWELPVRIEVDAHGAAHSWVRHFNERNVCQLEQHRQEQERADARLRPFWLVLLHLLRRLLRYLFGGAATE